MNELIGCICACLVSGFMLGMIFTAFCYCCDFKIKKLKQKKNIKKLQRLRIKLMLNKG